MDTSEKNAKGQIKVLSNSEINKNTSFFIYDITPVNNSSSITNNVGAKVVNNMFVHNQNFYNQGENPNILLDNVQMYDPDKIDNFMILRGRNRYDAETATDDDMRYESINVEDINTQNEWRGIQYTISNSDNDSSCDVWSGNVNINYNRACSHNSINNLELNKMYIKVLVGGPCLQIMKGEKIPVVIFYKDILSASVTDLTSPLGDVNKLYSGYYFVDGFKIIYKENNHKDEMLTNYQTEFILKRREWPAPVDYKKE
jgi:hypothetical protein